MPFVVIEVFFPRNHGSNENAQRGKAGFPCSGFGTGALGGSGLRLSTGVNPARVPVRSRAVWSWVAC